MKLFNILISIMILTSQLSSLYASAIATSSYMYSIKSYKNDFPSIIEETSSPVNSIDYFNTTNNGIMDKMIDNLFSSELIDRVVLEITDLTYNISLKELKHTDFIPKKSQDGITYESKFGSNFNLGSDDSDGFYVGYVNRMFGTQSRGYYIKKYTNITSDYDTVKNFVEIGKANFVDTLKSNIDNYIIRNNKSTIPPMLLSYLSYTNGFTNISNEISTIIADKSQSQEKLIEMSNNVNYNLHYGSDLNNELWSGYLDMPFDTNDMNNDGFSIKDELLNIDYDYTDISKNSDGSGTTTEKLLGTSSNNMFYNGGAVNKGYIFNYNGLSYDDNLFTHLQMSNTFMADNNIKRGYIFSNHHKDRNMEFKTKKTHVGGCCGLSIQNRYYYWFELEYGGGVDLFSTYFVDEGYMNDWHEMNFNNKDIYTSSVVLPTILPVNTYAKLPSLNKKGYGMFFSTNHNSILYENIEDSSLVKNTSTDALFNIQGINDTNTFKSGVKETTSFSMLTIFVIIVVVSALTIGYGTYLGQMIGESLEFFGYGTMGAATEIATASGSISIGMYTIGSVSLTSVELGMIAGLGVVASVITNFSDLPNITADYKNIQGQNMNMDERKSIIKQIINNVIYVGNSDFDKSLRDSNVYFGILASGQAHNKDKLIFNEYYDKIALKTSYDLDDLGQVKYYDKDGNHIDFFSDEYPYITNMLDGDALEYWKMDNYRYFDRVQFANKYHLYNQGISDLTTTELNHLGFANQDIAQEWLDEHKSFNIKASFKSVMKNYLGE